MINGLELWIVHGTVPPLGARAFTLSWAPNKVDVSSCHPIILKSCAKRHVPVIARYETAATAARSIAGAVYD